jgi:DNA/RNA-binding domain of Phe-tRNA-synthetase-like protein
VDASRLTGAEPELVRGAVDPRIEAEFPGLGLVHLTVDQSPGKTPRAIKERLRELSNRFRGAQAITMRQDPVPWAYRVFYRHVGLDPDADRTPVEQAAVERLLHGGFRSQNLLDDALLIGLLETGVPIWALDADRVEGPLGIRLAEAEEPLGRSGQGYPLPAGRLVVADAQGPVAVLFGELAPGHGVTSATTRMNLFSLRVTGVPDIHVEEAFWACLAVLDQG